MKFDAHIKLTNAALRLLRNRHPQTGGLDSGLLPSQPRIWLHDARRSTFLDNYAFGAGGALSWPISALLPKFFATDLAQAVSMVDVGDGWTHEHPDGQKYHFMKAPGESCTAGYRNALGFIHHHTLASVSLAKGLLGRTGSTSASRPADSQPYRREMALALHSLQDSFSTAHVRRSFDDGVPETLRTTGTLDGAAPIRGLFVYVLQDAFKHGDDDYTSGGLDSGPGRLAVEASAELIAMSLGSIKSSGGLVGWDSFVRKWLRSGFDTNFVKQAA